jgi:hypothetical protein
MTSKQNNYKSKKLEHTAKEQINAFTLVTVEYVRFQRTRQCKFSNHGHNNEPV